MKKVVCIVGPTGVGKSECAINVAKTFQNEIISGDSVQVYKELNIGSAKITDMQGIKHHLIDILEPNEDYSVCDFQKEVRKKIEQIDRPLIVGGTGLYVKAALYNYEFDDDKRDLELEKEYDDKKTEELYQELLELDENSSVDKYNRQRVLRALLSAKKQNFLSKKISKSEPLYDDLIILLLTPRDIIYRRINDRVVKMIEQGLVVEVEQLLKKGIRVKAIGYNEIYKYLDGEISLDEAIFLIQKNSRHYAKRQLTWYKNQMNCITVDALNNPFEKVCSLMNSFYRTSIRKANRCEIDECIELSKKVVKNLNDNNQFYWNDRYPTPDFFEEDIKRGNAYVILYDEKIAGYITISSENDWGLDIKSDWYLGRLMVDPSIRRSHLASLLFDHLFKIYKGTYSLLVHEENKKGLLFYESLGFKNNGLVYPEYGSMVYISKDVKK